MDISNKVQQSTTADCSGHQSRSDHAVNPNTYHGLLFVQTSFPISGMARRL